MDTIKRSVLTVLGSFLLIVFIAYIGVGIYADTHQAPDPYEVTYPVWTPPDNEYDDEEEARLLPRKLHLMRPDLIPYPLYIETYA